jgi:uncharacterized membrane protein YhaH (DUF805 family)
VGLFFALALALDLMILGGWIGKADLSNPPPLVYVFAVPLFVLALALIIDFGFRRGTVGPNRYGPDPLETSA